MHAEYSTFRALSVDQNTEQCGTVHNDEQCTVMVAAAIESDGSHFAFDDCSYSNCSYSDSEQLQCKCHSECTVSSYINDCRYIDKTVDIKNIIGKLDDWTIILTEQLDRNSNLFDRTDLTGQPKIMLLKALLKARFTTI